MKRILSSSRHHYVARVRIFLIVISLIAGMVGCGGGGIEYDLTIASTAGGSITTPGEGTFTYDEGEVVNLVAEAKAGYYFVNWTGDVSTIADVEDVSTTITMNGDYSITANFPPSPVEYEIGISQIVIHPALDAAREGFKDALTEAVESEGAIVTYDEQDAALEPSIAATIAESFVDDDVDLICAIATQSVQAAALAVNGTDIPVIFNSVTNPVLAGVVDSWDVPGGQVTGVSDFYSLDPQPQLQLIVDIFEANNLTFEKLGVIYNPGDDHSVYAVKTRLPEAIELLGLDISVEESPAYDTAEVSAAAEALVGRVDSIWVPSDNTVVTAFEAVVGVAEENDIPLFGADIRTIERGAIGCWGLDYYLVGYASGEMAAEILLEGANPATMPVQRTPADLLYLNPGAAERMGVTIPEDLLDIAHQIIE